mmetsp:Transcript_37820/g.60721  ORF Transcript_37820/g.60721 Transcript_37820/m.60721 type:complete len:314 (-) Transcript_37820:152-1093(-)
MGTDTSRYYGFFFPAGENEMMKSILFEKEVLTILFEQQRTEYLKQRLKTILWRIRNFRHETRVSAEMSKDGLLMKVSEGRGRQVKLIGWEAHYLKYLNSDFREKTINYYNFFVEMAIGTSMAALLFKMEAEKKRLDKEKYTRYKIHSRDSLKDFKESVPWTKEHSETWRAPLIDRILKTACDIANGWRIDAIFQPNISDNIPDRFSAEVYASCAIAKRLVRGEGHKMSEYLTGKELDSVEKNIKKLEEKNITQRLLQNLEASEIEGYFHGKSDIPSRDEEEVDSKKKKTEKIQGRMKSRRKKKGKKKRRNRKH